MHRLQESQPASSKLYKQFLDTLEGILFFGTPAEGMAIEHLIAMVGDNPNRTFLEQIRGPSDMLTSMKNNFRQIFTSRDLQVYSFYETRKTPTPKEIDGKWVYDKSRLETLVDWSKAKNGRVWEEDDKFLVALPKDHSGLVKFSSSDEELETVLDCFEDIRRAHQNS
jgi:hypothetical protein